MLICSCPSLHPFADESMCLVYSTSQEIFKQCCVCFYGCVSYRSISFYPSLLVTGSTARVVLPQWAYCQIHKIAGCACAGNAGNVFPRHRLQGKPLVSDPGMHHGTCVTHVPWCMSGSLTRGGWENVPGIPGACAPAILRIWQEAHTSDVTLKIMGSVYYGDRTDDKHKTKPNKTVYIFHGIYCRYIDRLI